MSKSKPHQQTVDEYIGNFAGDVREKLETVRKLMQEEVPDAEEVISYGIPTFKKNGKPIVYFAGFKNHISVFPAIDELPESLQRLEVYRTGKGTFQFPFGEPLPLDLISKFVRFRMKLNEKNMQTKRGAGDNK